MPVTSPTAVTGQTTPAQKNAVPYAVMHDIRETCDPTTTGYTVTLVVDGQYTLGGGVVGGNGQFEYDMLGYSRVNGAVLERVLPEPCGRDPRAYCVKLESVLHVPDALDAGAVAVNAYGWPTYDQEAFLATYAIPLYKVLEDDEVTYEHERFCVWRSKITAQSEKIPGGGYKYIGTDIKVSEVSVKTGRMIDLTCKWLDVPFYNYARLKTLCNKINSAAVTWNGTTYDAETVLVTGIESEPRLNAVGDSTYDITFAFSVRTDGRTWNKFWQDGSNKYVEVSDTGGGGGNKPFETTDLNTLWALL